MGVESMGEKSVSRFDVLKALGVQVAGDPDCVIRVPGFADGKLMDLERQYTTGQARIVEADGGDVDGPSEVPMTSSDC